MESKYDYDYKLSVHPDLVEVDNDQEMVIKCLLLRTPMKNYIEQYTDNYYPKLIFDKVNQDISLVFPKCVQNILDSDVFKFDNCVEIQDDKDCYSGTLVSAIDYKEDCAIVHTKYDDRVHYFLADSHKDEYFYGEAGGYQWLPLIVSLYFRGTYSTIQECIKKGCL